MAKSNAAGGEVRRDEDLRVACAAGGVVACARLGHLTRIGLGPAREPGCSTLRRLVGPEGGAAKGTLAQRFVESVLPSRELSPDLRAQLEARRLAIIRRARQQLDCKSRGHQKAHELAAELLGDID